jgi:hypothetical protein
MIVTTGLIITTTTYAKFQDSSSQYLRFDISNNPTYLVRETGGKYIRARTLQRRERGIIERCMTEGEKRIVTINRQIKRERERERGILRET